MFRSALASGEASTADKWSIRAEEWDKKIEEEKKKLGANFPAAIVPTMSASMQYGGVSSMKPLREEMEFYITDKFKMLNMEIRELIEREWRVKLPEVEYGIKEKHAELTELFDRNTRTALNIGDKVLEVTCNVNSLKKDLKLIEGWKREFDSKFGDSIVEVQDLKAESGALRKLQMEISKDTETLGLKIKEIEGLRMNIQSAESRLQTYCKEELRQNERRAELLMEKVTGKVQQLEDNLGADTEGWRNTTKRLASSEETVGLMTRGFTKLKSKISQQLNELSEQSDEIEELRNEVKEITQNTVPGYCQGCRLVMQELENKLYTVNQSICYLDKTVKSGRLEVSPLQPPAPVPAPAAPVRSLTPTPAMKSAPEPSEDPRIQVMENRIDALESELSSMRSAVEMLRMEGSYRNEDRRGSTEVSDAVQTKMQHMLEDSEVNVLDQVKETLALWSEAKARQSDVDDLKEHIRDLINRMEMVEDKLDLEENMEGKGRHAETSASSICMLWVVILFIATILASFAFSYQHPNAVAAVKEVAQESAKSEQFAQFSSPIKIMTVLSGPYRNSCEMLAGAIHNGIPIEVLGWGSSAMNVKDFKKKEDKLKNKIPLLYERVKDLPDDTILMFVDGGDVLWQRGPEAIYTAYKQMATAQKPIIFSSERNCWIRSLPRETCSQWPKKENTPYRWLNSGCWMGELGPVKKLLTYVNESAAKMTFESCPKCGDQALFGKAFFADGWNKTMDLDYYNNVCQNLHSAQDDFQCDERRNGRVVNCKTNTVPALLHFNGNPQHPALRPKLWMEKMWWNDKLLPHDAAINIEGTMHPLQELCPKLKFAPAPASRDSMRKPDMRRNSGIPAQVMITSGLFSVAGALLVAFLCCRVGRKRHHSAA